MTNSTKPSKSPWPTKDAMNQIYSKNLWGGNENEFYSGEGSHKPEIVDPYVNSVKLFLASFQNKLSVCDLGCGDFNVGKELVSITDKYFAIDIVEELIEFNRRRFTAPNLEFLCLDIAKDELPKADCVILRQVLQHLSNDEVKAILNKIIKYKYLILSEHIPVGNFESNKNIISGQGIRLKKLSGIDISKDPFNFKFKEKVEITSYVLDDGKSKIVSSIYEIH